MKSGDLLVRRWQFIQQIYAGSFDYYLWAKTWYWEIFSKVNRN